MDNNIIYLLQNFNKYLPIIEKSLKLKNANSYKNNKLSQTVKNDIFNFISKEQLDLIKNIMLKNTSYIENKTNLNQNYNLSDKQLLKDPLIELLILNNIITENNEISYNKLKQITRDFISLLFFFGNINSNENIKSEYENLNGTNLLIDNELLNNTHIKNFIDKIFSSLVNKLNQIKNIDNIQILSSSYIGTLIQNGSNSSIFINKLEEAIFILLSMNWQKENLHLNSNDISSIIDKAFNLNKKHFLEALNFFKDNKTIVSESFLNILYKSHQKTPTSIMNILKYRLFLDHSFAQILSKDKIDTINKLFYKIQNNINNLQNIDKIFKDIDVNNKEMLKAINLISKEIQNYIRLIFNSNNNINNMKELENNFLNYNEISKNIIKYTSKLLNFNEVKNNSNLFNELKNLRNNVINLFNILNSNYSIIQNFFIEDLGSILLFYEKYSKSDKMFKKGFIYSLTIEVNTNNIGDIKVNLYKDKKDNYIINFHPQEKETKSIIQKNINLFFNNIKDKFKIKSIAIS